MGCASSVPAQSPAPAPSASPRPAASAGPAPPPRPSPPPTENQPKPAARAVKQETTNLELRAPLQPIPESPPAEAPHPKPPQPAAAPQEPPATPAAPAPAPPASLAPTEEPAPVPRQRKDPDSEATEKVWDFLQPLQAPDTSLLEPAGSPGQAAWDLGRLLEWAEKKEGKEVCWVAGKRGDRPCELSAALVEAAESRGVVVLRHFISCTTFSSQDPVAVVRTLAFQLFWAFSEELAKVFTALCGKEEPFNCFSDMQEALEELLAKPVSKLPSDLGCPLLVVVDSLEAAGSTHQSNRMIRLVQMLPKALGRKAKILVTSAGSDSFLATSLGPLNPMKVPMTDCKAAGAPVVGMAGRLGLTGDADDSCGIEAMYTKYLEAKGAEPAKLASVLEPLLAAREPLTVEQLHRCGVPDTTGALQTLSGLFTLVTGGGGADGTENCVWATDPSVLDFFRAQGPWHVDETSGHRSIYDMLLQDLHSPEEDGLVSMYSLRNAFHHALKGGGRIDSIVTSLDYWKGCYEHAELTAVRDILRIPVGALSGPALDAQRLLGTHHDKLLKDPEAIAQLAYDSPHGCIFAKMASSQGHAPPSGGYLLSKPERWPMELRTIAAHSKGINAVAVDWNGILVASGSDDNTACVFDVSTGTRLMSFEGHKDEVTAVAFSPDASTLATASWDCSVILWSLISGKERLCIKGHKSGVTCLAFRNDGQALLTGSDDNSVQIWDPATGYLIIKLDGHAMAVNAVAFRPDGKLAASGSEDSTICVWDPESGTELHCLEGHAAGINCVVFISETTLASGGYDRSVRLWDTTSGDTLRVLQDISGAVSTLSLTSDGMLATAAGKTIQVWDPATGSEVQRLQGKQPDVSSLAVCPTSPLLASSSRDGSIQLWDRRSEFGGVQAHKDTVRCVAASVDGRLVASGGWDHEIAVWDLATGRLKTQLEGHKSAVMALAFASSQEAESDAASAATLVSAGNDHTLRLWNADAGEEKHLIAQGEQFQNFTSVVMLGSTVVAGEEISQSTSHNITLWDTSTGDEAGCLSGTNGPIQSLALARNAGLLVSGCSGDNACIIIWDMASKEAKERIMCDEEVVGVTTTPAGNLLAAVFSNGNVGVWDASTCKKRLALTLSHSASALAFSPDGRSLAVGDSDASVRLLDSGTGEELMAWQGHSGSVTAVAFSPCGTRIYTGSEDQTVRVWIMPE